MSLTQLNQEYERIMSQSEGADRDRALAALLDVIKHEYHVPLMQNVEWERKHKSVIALYRKVSMSRKTI